MSAAAGAIRRGRPRGVRGRPHLPRFPADLADHRVADARSAARAGLPRWLQVGRRGPLLRAAFGRSADLGRSSRHPRDDLSSGSSSSSSRCRWASGRRSTSRSTRTRTAGTTACSRSTSRTSPRCLDRLRDPRPCVPRARDRPRPGPARRRDDPDPARPPDGDHRRAGGIRAVPDSIRQGAYALGSTKWQVVWRQVFPAAIPGSRPARSSRSPGLGRDRAALLLVGALTYVSFNPTVLGDFTALPVQIYQWIARPQEEFKDAGGGGDHRPLLAILLTLNAFAIWLGTNTNEGGDP